MNNKTIIFICILLVIGIGFYYFFIDTLSISQIVGKSGNPKTTIFINLFDFDTGLTRYDIYNLGKKSDYWNKRMKEVYSIQDPTLRNIENEKLMAEMMQDPALKKITRKLFGFGGKTSLAIMQAVANFSFF